MYLYPLAAIFSIYVSWFVTWLTVGHPPQVYLDDPSGIGGVSGILHMTSVIAVTSIPLAVIYVVSMLNSAPNSLAMVRHFGKFGVVAGYGGMFAMVSILSRFDPGGVFKWWMD